MATFQPLKQQKNPFWIPVHKRPYPLYCNAAMFDTGIGSFLEVPREEHLELEGLEVAGVKAGHACLQGFRSNMEDAHLMAPLPLPGQELSTEKCDHCIFAILDGHAGRGAAINASHMIVECLQMSSGWASYVAHADRSSPEAIECLSRGLVEAFIEIDRRLLALVLRHMMDNSGAAVVVTVVTPTHVVCASVGDSRAVVGHSKSTVSLTKDHKPTRRLEKKRIIAGGGFVKDGRVNGCLAMSRAVGDFVYKKQGESPRNQMVSCIPDIGVHIRKPTDEYLVLACDGVWDVMENHESLSFLKLLSQTPEISQQPTPIELAQGLIQTALQLQSTDNISALVVKLK